MPGTRQQATPTHAGARKRKTMTVAWSVNSWSPWPQGEGLVGEDPAEEDRGREVEVAHSTDRIEEERQRPQEHGVHDDLARGLPETADHREHRHVGRRIVVAITDGERPEMGRRP